MVLISQRLRSVVTCFFIVFFVTKAVSNDTNCYDNKIDLAKSLEPVLTIAHKFNPEANVDFDNGECIFQNDLSLVSNHFTYGDEKFCKNLAFIVSNSNTKLRMSDLAILNNVDRSAIIMRYISKLSLEYQQAALATKIVKINNDLAQDSDICEIKHSMGSFGEEYLKSINNPACASVNELLSHEIISWNNNVQRGQWKDKNGKDNHPVFLEDLTKLYGSKNGEDVAAYLNVLSEYMDHDQGLLKSKTQFESALQRRRDNLLDGSNNKADTIALLSQLAKHISDCLDKDPNESCRTKEAALNKEISNNVWFLEYYTTSKVYEAGESSKKMIEPITFIRKALKLQKGGADSNSELLKNIFEKQYKRKRDELVGKNGRYCKLANEGQEHFRNEMAQLCTIVKLNGPFWLDDAKTNRFSCMDRKVRRELDKDSGRQLCYLEARNLCALKFENSVGRMIADKSYYAVINKDGNELSKKLLKRLDYNQCVCNDNLQDLYEDDYLSYDIVSKRQREKDVETYKERLPKYCQDLSLSAKDCHLPEIDKSLCEKTASGSNSSNSSGSITSALDSAIYKTGASDIINEIANSHSSSNFKLSPEIISDSGVDAGGKLVDVPMEDGSVSGSSEGDDYEGSSLPPSPVEIPSSTSTVSTESLAAPVGEVAKEESIDKDIEEEVDSKEDLIARYEEMINRLMDEKQKNGTGESDSAEELIKKLKKDIEGQQKEIASLQQKLKDMEKANGAKKTVAAPANYSNPMNGFNSWQGNNSGQSNVQSNRRSGISEFNPESMLERQRQGSRAEAKSSENAKANSDSVAAVNPEGYVENAVGGRAVASISHGLSPLSLQFSKLASMKELITDTKNDTITYGSVIDIIEEQKIDEKKLANVTRDVIVIEDESGNILYTLVRYKDGYRKLVGDQVVVRAKEEGPKVESVVVEEKNKIKARIDEGIDAIKFLTQLNEKVSAGGDYQEVMSFLNESKGHSESKK